MNRRDRRVPTGLGLPLPSPKAVLVRRAGLLVLRTLSSPTLASWANVAVSVAVVYVMYRALYALLHKAALVIGGGELPCLVK